MSRFIIDDSYQGAINVTPSDTALIPFPVGTLYSRGIYIGGTGDLAVEMADGTTTTFSSIPVGFYRLGVKKILAATTATNVKALY